MRLVEGVGEDLRGLLGGRVRLDDLVEGALHVEHHRVEAAAAGGVGPRHRARGVVELDQAHRLRQPPGRVDREDDDPPPRSAARSAERGGRRGLADAAGAAADDDPGRRGRRGARRRRARRAPAAPASRPGRVAASCHPLLDELLGEVVQGAEVDAAGQRRQLVDRPAERRELLALRRSRAPPAARARRASASRPSASRPAGRGAGRRRRTGPPSPPRRGLPRPRRGRAGPGRGALEVGAAAGPGRAPC